MRKSLLAPPYIIRSQTPNTGRVMSKFFPLTQLKKGNKEPNPMVQLSVQDVTQESKVGVSTALAQGKGEQALPSDAC